MQGSAVIYMYVLCDSLQTPTQVLQVQVQHSTCSLLSQITFLQISVYNHYLSSKQGLMRFIGVHWDAQHRLKEA